MQKIITKTIILLAVLTLALSVNYIFAAWTGPTEAPPGGNTPTPVHVGTTNQVKDGGLSLDALSVFGRGWFQDSIVVNNPASTTPSTGGEQDLNLDVEGAIGAKYYCDENGNNCMSAPFGSGWVDITSDTDPWNLQCEYKIQIVSGCGTNTGVVVHMTGIGQDNGQYIIASPDGGHFLYVHYSDKGINVPAGTDVYCGAVPVKTYERCGGIGSSSPIIEARTVLHSTQYQVINFTNTFTTPPTVVVTSQAGGFYCSAYNITTTSFQTTCQNDGGDYVVADMDYIAIGQ